MIMDTEVEVIITIMKEVVDIIEALEVTIEEGDVVEVMRRSISHSNCKKLSGQLQSRKLRKREK